MSQLEIAREPVAAPDPLPHAIHCLHCGRRLLDYSADLFTGHGALRIRCRDCRRWTMLRGIDIVSLAAHVSHHGMGA